MAMGFKKNKYLPLIKVNKILSAKEKAYGRKARLALLNILEDVEEERLRLDTIVDSIAEGLYVLDVEKRFVKFNKAAENLLGWKKDEVIGRKDIEIFERKKGGKHSCGMLCSMNEEWLRGDTVSLKSLYLRRKNGKSMEASIIAAPVRNTRGRIVNGVVVFRDVTEEHRVERMRSEFITIISHQLRAPISAIRWLTEMFLDGELGKLTKEQLAKLHDIEESNKKMINLINDLLITSRIERGKVFFEAHPTQLEDIIKETIKDIANYAATSKVKIIYKKPAKTLPKIIVDNIKIREAIYNLIHNSIKYNNAGGTVIISTKKTPKEVIFIFKDTGIGIPEQERKNIFSKFFRGEKATAHNTEGSGLGLFVVKNIVESSGGRIWFKSQEDKGTTFYFTLPLMKKVK